MTAWNVVPREEERTTKFTVEGYHKDFILVFLVYFVSLVFLLYISLNMKILLFNPPLLQRQPLHIRRHVRIAADIQ